MYEGEREREGKERTKKGSLVLRHFFLVDCCLLCCELEVSGVLVVWVLAWWDLAPEIGGKEGVGFGDLFDN